MGNTDSNTATLDERGTEMTQTLVCDWFMPNDGNDALVIVLDAPESTYVDLDSHAALAEAFYTEFGEDNDLNPDMPVSEYLYTVATFNGDVSSLLTSVHTVLRIA